MTKCMSTRQNPRNVKTSENKPDRQLNCRIVCRQNLVVPLHDRSSNIKYAFNENKPKV